MLVFAANDRCSSLIVASRLLISEIDLSWHFLNKTFFGFFKFRLPKNRKIERLPHLCIDRMYPFGLRASSDLQSKLCRRLAGRRVSLRRLVK